MVNKMKFPSIKGGNSGGGGLFITLFVVFLAAMAAAAGTAIYKNWAAPKIASSTGADFLVEQTPEQELLAAQVTEDDIKSCSGISSVNYLYDDKNIYSAATDPATTLTIFSPISKTVADDATTTSVPIKTQLSVLAGNNLGTPSTTYFAEEFVVDSVCSDISAQHKLAQAGAPTLTLTNDNGKTVNSDANDETVSADTTYTPTLTVKAPSNKCSAKHGAVVAVYYDQTYWNDIDSSDSSSYDGKVLTTKRDNTNTSGVDQVAAFLYDGELCDGDSVDLTFDLTTDSSNNPAEDQGVVFEWLPIQKDLDTDTLSKVIMGIHDDKNNNIFLGNQSIEYFVQ